MGNESVGCFTRTRYYTCITSNPHYCGPYANNGNYRLPQKAGCSVDDGLVDLMESLAKIYGANVRSDDKPVYGWPSLRAYVLRECIEFCEALSHRAGVAHFTSLLFTVAGDQIDKDEQVRLAGNLPRIAGSSRKKGVLIETDYWDMFLVQNIEIVGYHTPNTLLNCCVGPLKASCAHQHRLAFDKSLL